MTAFEQAWSLLKSIDAMKDPNNAVMKNNQIFATRPKLIRRRNRTFQSRLPIDNLMTHNTPDTSPIIDGRYKLPLMHQSLAPITPLEQRLPKKPIPSHIEYDGNHINTGGVFNLIGTEGQKLSSIQPKRRLSDAVPLSEQFIGVGYGDTPPNFRRQGFYEKLMRGLLNAGLGIKSDSRNSMSQPFHENLINTMSPNINVKKPRGALSNFSPITYRRKDRPNVTMEELKQMQEAIPGLMSNDPNQMEIAASGLDAADYGSLPIRIKQPKPQPTNVPASKVGVVAPANDTSSQTSLDEYSPSNFRGIDAIRERHRIQNLFDGDDY